ncbi:MAG: hypothetical protein J7K98_02545 [Candidatus Aenigmarchaeota archaeon]|nr:hypothetical protein [Candidatus Aenigmarchaeota archaeon]
MKYEETLPFLPPLKIKLTNEELQLNFWPVKYKINLEDIRNVKQVNKLPWYVGWGLRIGLFSKTLYFVTKHKDCIMVEKKRGFWERIVFSSNNPEELISRLRRLIS